MTELAEVRAQIAAIVEELGDDAGQAAHEADMAAIEERAIAVERALRAVADLRGITVPAAILDTAPEALVRGSGFDRATHAVMGWSAYAVAPVAVRSTVVAVLQADAERELDPRDASILWTFAAGVAQVYESASLRRTLRHERRQMRRLLTWLDARSSELADATIAFVSREGSELPQPEEMDGHERRPERERDGSAVLDAVLTRREVEILRLLADGLTNRAIAAELVISGGTVKFHVNSILRKLHVANRAEAVARYYALLDARR
jgi:DNA-binding CsgD family transcriptional regulator